MGIRSIWPLLLVMVVPLTLAAYGRRLAQSAPTTTQSSAADSQDDVSVRILQTADSWRTGDPLPQELRRFRHYGADIPTTLDSASLIAQLNIPSLITELVVESVTDPATRVGALSLGLVTYVKRAYRNHHVLSLTLSSANRYTLILHD